uniref:Uncharacterized protein n=1 Tax=Arundo donax TaxID=35708 RepID=A0A0A9HGX6_ARUDO
MFRSSLMHSKACDRKSDTYCYIKGSFLWNFQKKT